MATAPQKRISKNRYECSICHERYKHPKILDCLHSFCEACLEKYYADKTGGASKIPCPRCRRETALPENGIRDLDTNFHLIDQMKETSMKEEMALLSSKRLLCEICDEGNEATYRCLECAQSICSNCHKTHLRFAASSGHTVAPLEDIHQGEVGLERATKEERFKCQKHEGKTRRLYCETCEELICQACTTVDHAKPQHHVTDIGAASLKYRRLLKEIFSSAFQGTDELQNSLAAVSQAKADLVRKITKILKDVEDVAARVIEEIRVEASRITDEIEAVREDRNRNFDEYEAGMNEMLQGEQHSLETTQDVLDTASDSHFLSLFPLLRKNLTRLSNQHPPPQLDQGLSYLRFEQSQSASDIRLGQLHLQAKWELYREFGKEGSGPGEFNGAHGIAACQPEGFAVADWHNKRVVVCSAEGDTKNIIATRGNPRGIAATTQQQLVVVDTTPNVKVFKEDSTLASEFSTLPQSEAGKTDVDLRAVVVKKDGTILVSDAKRNVLTEHSPTDGSLLRTLPVNVRPSYLAVDSEDRVVISGGVEAVEVADTSGTKLFAIKPTIKGRHVKYSNGVCCDASGIYIAVDNGEDTGHIHHYSGQGEFFSCVVQGLHNPYGLTFTADGQQLAVADCYSVKVYHKI